ncbi:MAG: hypothetical protein ISR99_02275 [Parcubacteria group bacterium]|nr:hypothetical protein [Parcubacteria group bacterium]
MLRIFGLLVALVAFVSLPVVAGQVHSRPGAEKPQWVYGGESKSALQRHLFYFDLASGGQGGEVKCFPYIRASAVMDMGGLNYSFLCALEGEDLALESNLRVWYKGNPWGYIGAKKSLIGGWPLSSSQKVEVRSMAGLQVVISDYLLRRDDRSSKRVSIAVFTVGHFKAMVAVYTHRDYMVKDDAGGLPPPTLPAIMKIVDDMFRNFVPAAPRIAEGVTPPSSTTKN